MDRNRFRLLAAGLAVAVAAFGFLAAAPRATALHDVAVPVLPQARAGGKTVSLTLYAKLASRAKQAFAYEGKFVPPVIRVVPGGRLRITYVNELPVHTTEKCAIATCRDMTNLHFHGMEVSPQFGQDDVLDMMAMPGETLHYDVHMPSDIPPGLYWYHTHPHTESDREALDGMSGALVVEGIDRYVPQVRGLGERILVVRETELKQDDARSKALMQRVSMVPTPCGAEDEAPDSVFSVNGAFRPSIAIAPGERQFWRIVNAAADRYIDIRLGTPFKVVAFDGMPLAYHDPQHPTEMLDHVLIPPAGRVEAIVTGPAAGENAQLRSQCVNTGPGGDPTPAQTLADIVLPSAAATPLPPVPVENAPPVYKPLRTDELQSAAPSFTATFTEHHSHFYINHREFAMDAPPMTTVRVGTLVHWRIVNKTNEVHPFHIHQVHFLAYAQDGIEIPHPVWLDTVNVPPFGNVDIILDATNPQIRGMSVFHCHILSHEDKGMMAKVLFK